MTRKHYLTVLSIGLLIICVYFLIDTMSKKNEQETLVTQITEAIGMISLMPEVPSDLEQRLADIQASLDSLQSSLPDEVNTTQVIDTFLELADANQVKVTSLSSSPWSLINIEEHDYLIFVVSLEVKSEVYDLVAFLRSLESLPPSPPISVQRLSVIRDEEQMVSSTLVTASLDIALYTQPPAIDSTTDSDNDSTTDSTTDSN